jgi:DNA (cytosine-5)-methyltransferase 1
MTGSPLVIGSLFSGYGGLEQGIEAALRVPSRTAWVSDIDRGACQILAHHYPDSPNLGDISEVDWAEVEPIDILTGGSPCQDLSSAGRRAGMTEGTRSNLWVMMREAIAQLHPRLVVWENVRGAYSAPADSLLEQCEGCMGDRGGQPSLRALGRVLGDLADIGYDACWIGIRAADIGAPHGRFRVILSAWPKDDLSIWQFIDDGMLELGDLALMPTPLAQESDGSRVNKGGNPTLAGAVLGVDEAAAARTGVAPTSGLLPTPSTLDKDFNAATAEGSAARDETGKQKMLAHAVGKLLPTPAAVDHKGNSNPASRGRKPDLMRDVVDLLPTPTAGDGERHSDAQGRTGGPSLTEVGKKLLPTPVAVVRERTEEERRHRRAEKIGGNLDEVFPLLPTPRVVHHSEPPEQVEARGYGPNLASVTEHLLPTPNDFHMGNTESPEEWLERRADVEERTGTRHGPALPVVAQSVADGHPLIQAGDGPQLVEPGADIWGPYAAAIHRWEEILGRPAPDPTEVGPKNKPRLASRLTEWMMGLPDGHVTAPEVWAGFTGRNGKAASATAIRNAQLKACGNGVVPQQATEAIRRAKQALLATGVIERESNADD